MQIIDKYLLYWPVLAASAVFLILGFWWRLSAARAMELAPKPLDWVKNYRSGGFPIRRVLPAHPRFRWWALLLVLLVSGAFGFGKLLNMGLIYQIDSKALLCSRYGLLVILLRTLGGGAVYCLLLTLFDSGWVALPGSLLFAASASRGHVEGCFLAFALLFLLLWLRAEKPGFPAELLYWAAILALAPVLAMRPFLLWLLPCFVLVHWYKLNFLRRNRQLSGGKLLLSLLAALAVWALVGVLAVALQRLLMYSFHLSSLRRLASFAGFRRACGVFLRAARAGLLKLPTRGMTLDLLLDAPLFGFGLWGCCSAWTLARQRRDARGVFVLLSLAALLAAWLLTGCYLLTLGLTLSTACVLRDADLGKKRFGTVLLTLAGILWYVLIQVAAWYFPLTAGLVERLV